ncbi:MurR/RpiR family transcriptional regulator [Flexivirga oryzae]|uniref:DNA-binding MurR/RpiR family transcriptional regulator n=1 Tax=Flexivirga oryzae TaxID=1794944 RepID=A0A839NE95_9MICO|nr:MurR/RpiR family transcriptional regulator [Flexivirga oryzae]MBB2893485.1 DNA-binding MurR/RpiR family transcriptional regulator [Flexivirga oryzae]
MAKDSSDLKADPTRDVLVRMRSSLPQLQPAEHRVAEVVLKDPAAAAQLSITELASRADTSVATVARFSHSVGFGGYPQLRLALAGAAARESALGGPARKPPADLDEAESTEDIVAAIVHHEVRALQETAEHLDLTALDAAIAAVAAADRVEIFGVQASGLVATDLQYKLIRAGRIAFAWTEFHSAMTSAVLLGAGDVAIGISHSGATLDVIETLAAAKEAGATTIAITNFSGAPIVDHADIVLTTAARETAFRSGALASRTAQLAVVDFLFVGVARTSLEATTEALTRTYQAVRDGKSFKRRRSAGRGK